MSGSYVNLAYLAASVLFVLGLKGLTHPRTAVRGNLLGAAGMLIAVVVTLLDKRIVGFEIILAGVVAGAVVGSFLAYKIKMTAMPQLVAIFNGFGGGVSVLVSGVALIEAIGGPGPSSLRLLIAGVASGIIGTVTFWGSLVAFGKLQGLLYDKALVFTGRQVLNAILALATIGFGLWLVLQPSSSFYWIMVAVASLLGILLVMAIGGADMPVVIALLNSYSGLAAAATGFVLSNNVLIIAGSLVGASGIILTNIMCKAMNRSLANVVFGGFGAEEEAVGKKDDFYAGRVKSTTAEEVGMILESASRVVIVPGYGMAVAQAQHAVRNLFQQLEARGIEVEFGIHPVAGRMPGHMNVLLAEENIPYEKLREMDDINETFERTDLVLVIGANDVVNPLARTDPDCPIAGMPILDVDKARTVVVIKRSLSPGFAGIDNPLFVADNTLMLFADGREAVMDLVASVKESCLHCG